MWKKDWKEEKIYRKSIIRLGALSAHYPFNILLLYQFFISDWISCLLPFFMCMQTIRCCLWGIEKRKDTRKKLTSSQVKWDRMRRLIKINLHWGWMQKKNKKEKISCCYHDKAEKDGNLYRKRFQMIYSFIFVIKLFLCLPHIADFLVIKDYFARRPSFFYSLAAFVV